PVSIADTGNESRHKYHYLQLFQLNESQLLVLKGPYLRRSYQSQALVSDILLGALPNTLVLALAAFFLASVLGILFGLLAAVYRGGRTESFIMLIANLGISLPSFFAAILIAWLFGFVVAKYTGLNMFGSLYDTDPFRGRYLALQNLVLPAIAL